MLICPLDIDIDLGITVVAGARHHVLHLLAMYREMHLDDLKSDLAYVFQLNSKTINKIISELKMRELIEVKENSKTVKITQKGLIAYAQSIYCASIGLGEMKHTALEMYKAVLRDLKINAEPPQDCNNILL